MNRSIIGKAMVLVVLLTWMVLLTAPSVYSGTFQGGFAGFGGGVLTGGFAGFGGVPIGGLPEGGSGNVIVLVGGNTGGAGGSASAVPQPSSLLLTAAGLGVAAWGVWRNRR